MHDHVEALRIRSGLLAQCGKVADVDFEHSILRMPAMLANVRFLHWARIERVEIVDRGHVPAGLQEAIDEVTADEPGGAGHECTLSHRVLTADPISPRWLALTPPLDHHGPPGRTPRSGRKKAG